MSSIRRVTLPFAAAAIAVLTGCASDGEAELQAGAEVADPVDPARVPARAEDRQLAERLPPLERANFWAREYTKTPNDLDTALRFGSALRGIGSHERAVEVMTAIEVVHPMSGEVKLLKGRALSTMGRHTEARRALMAAATLMPTSADALAALGLSNDRLGDHISAQTAYRQALALSPARASTLSNLGLSLALTGDIEEAEQVLREAAVLDSENTHIRQNLALVLGLQGRYDEMIAAAGDAPEAVMRENVELLRKLRGDVVAGTAGDGAG
ncbi:MAG: tetratricopeptide repeat protein [Hyphomonadaceae bacterium]|nr:tetratricopeptide repeat protein [Hyphomonadaceae bacterium]